jgi:hypothetical protein
MVGICVTLFVFYTFKEEGLMMNKNFLNIFLLGSIDLATIYWEEFKWSLSHFLKLPNHQQLSLDNTILNLFIGAVRRVDDLLTIKILDRFI